MPALSWNPPPRVQPTWADPYLPDADVAEVPHARRGTSPRAWAEADLAGTEPAEPRWAAPMWAGSAPRQHPGRQR
jgi:hypothetical protein